MPHHNLWAAGRPGGPEGRARSSNLREDLILLRPPAGPAGPRTITLIQLKASTPSPGPGLRRVTDILTRYRPAQAQVLRRLRVTPSVTVRRRNAIASRCHGGFESYSA